MNFIFHIFIYICFLKNISSSDNITEKCQEICSIVGGECIINNLKCKCKQGYTTLFNEENLILCNYKRYNKIMAGSIELFFGFGFGHFYCKRYLNGSIQLFGEFISYCLIACLFLNFLLYDYNFNFGLFILTPLYIKLYCPLFVVIIFSWQLIDSVLFFIGYYRDGNNIDLF